MDSISSVSFATTQKAANLDGALALSILLEENRSLTLGTAQSTVKGLVDAIRAAPGNYATLLSSVAAAFDQAATSSGRLTKPAWTSAPGGVQNAVAGTVNSGFSSLVADVRSDATAALTTANAAKAGTATNSQESTLATAVVSATQLLLTALTQLDNNDDAGARANLATARTNATQALSDARALLATLQRGNNPDQARIAATQAVIAAAQSTLAALTRAETTAVTPLALAAGESPSTTKLSADSDPVTYLSTWGSSGAVSLTDATGQGIVIGPDGRVDSVPPGGDGWQFQKDSTFVLSDGTKVSYTPGNPASLLATRGEQMLTIGGLAAGQTPTQSLDNKGGLAADAARNDGYIFMMGADAGAWTLSGATLGDTPGSREVVASTPLTNEYAGADITDVVVTAQLTEALATLGIDLSQFDGGNGKMSSKEWPALLAVLESALLAAQDAFDASIANTKTAVTALLNLNQFLEQAILAVGKNADNQSVTGAAERDQLVRIQRDLNAGMKALKAPTEPTPTTGNVVGDAQSALTQIDSFGTAATAPANDNTPAAPSGGPTSEQSLRLAGRILSGFAGGAAAPKFLPPSSPTPANPAAPDTAPGPGDGTAPAVSAERAPAAATANAPATPAAPSSAGPAPAASDVAPAATASAAAEASATAPLTSGAESNPGKLLPADAATPAAPANPGPAPATVIDPAAKVAAGWANVVQAGWDDIQKADAAASLDAMLAAILQRPATPGGPSASSAASAPGPTDTAPPTPLSARDQALLRAVAQVLVSTGNDAPATAPARSEGNTPLLPTTANAPTPPASPLAETAPAPSAPTPPAAPRLTGADEALLRTVADLLSAAANETPPSTPAPSRPGNAPLPSGQDEALLRAIAGVLGSARNEPPTPASAKPPAATPSTPAPVAAPRLSRREEAVLRAVAAVLTAARNAPPANLDAAGQPLPPSTNSGQPILPGSNFAATGPDPLVSPDPTFGASDGSYREVGRRIDQYRGIYQDQLKVALQAKQDARQAVEQFIGIVAGDDQLRQVFSADDLSDDVRSEFKGKMENLEKDLGISWGGESEKTPVGQTNINLKALLSGMRL